MSQTVKNLPAMRKTQVQSLGQEDVLKKEIATDSSILVWKIPGMEDPGRLWSMGLQRVECLLISWLQSLSAVILEPPKIKSVTVSTVSPSISHEVMGLDAMTLVFRMLSFKPTF